MRGEDSSSDSALESGEMVRTPIQGPLGSRGLGMRDGEVSRADDGVARLTPLAKNLQLFHCIFICCTVSTTVQAWKVTRRLATIG